MSVDGMSGGMKRWHGLLGGLVFGAGLALSGMARPARVLGFLDLTGAWDPTLAFVMIGGLAVASPIFALARRRERALDGAMRPEVPSHGITARLVGGSVLFGIGWALAGICPGPALVALGAAPWPALVFALPMAAGLLAGRRF